MKLYNRVLRAAYSVLWAIQPEKLDAILAFLELKAAGHSPADETLAEMEAASVEAAARGRMTAAASSGSVAVLPLFGSITHRANLLSSYSGGTSIDKFTAQFRQALADPNVSAIVLDVDSPGGTVDGVPELAAEILQARGTKQIVAVCDCLMASAAYWIASAASEIVCTPSGQVGSIGVFMAHEDESEALTAQGIKHTLISAGKYKTEGNPFEPLSDEARAAMQGTVDDMYSLFVNAVAKGRGVKADDVRSGFGQGRVVSAKQAVSLGMVDRVATLDQVLSKLGVSRNAGNASAAHGSMPVVASADADSVAHAGVETPTASAELPAGESGNVQSEVPTQDCGCVGTSEQPTDPATAPTFVRLALLREQIRIASL